MSRPFLCVFFQNFRAIRLKKRRTIRLTIDKWALLAHTQLHFMGARFTEHKQGPFLSEIHKIHTKSIECKES